MSPSEEVDSLRIELLVARQQIDQLKLDHEMEVFKLKSELKGAEEQQDPRPAPLKTPRRGGPSLEHQLAARDREIGRLQLVISQLQENTHILDRKIQIEKGLSLLWLKALRQKNPTQKMSSPLPHPVLPPLVLPPPPEASLPESPRPTFSETKRLETARQKEAKRADLLAAELLKVQQDFQAYQEGHRQLNQLVDRAAQALCFALNEVPNFGDLPCETLIMTLLDKLRASLCVPCQESTLPVETYLNESAHHKYALHRLGLAGNVQNFEVFLSALYNEEFRDPQFYEPQSPLYEHKGTNTFLAAQERRGALTGSEHPFA